jgi:methylated-DNA-[protein]-cysteine S-methyltransferase
LFDKTVSNVFSAKLRTSFAVLGIICTETHLTGVRYLPLTEPELAPTSALAARVVRDLEAYLDDPRFRFDLPLQAEGTPFQQKVWRALRDIPSGETRSYKDIANVIHSAPRPVGNACGANPIALIVPCHRVIAADGSLGGFMNHVEGEAMDIKRWLLVHEQSFSRNP